MIMRLLIFLTLLLNGLSLFRIEDGPMLGSSGNVVLRYLNYYLPSSAKCYLLALKRFHNITLMLNVLCNVVDFRWICGDLKLCT